MKLELSVAEANELIKGICQPEGLFEMIRDNVRQSVGEYLSELMSLELTSFLAEVGMSEGMVILIIAMAPMEGGIPLKG
ncbi:MAG: hypothetical protein LWW94_10930 [Candidatus Desulfofervidaceae bacterium]|nr:hypothetical protein [Candidatus Desulfofervidaceae bacterium]